MTRPGRRGVIVAVLAIVAAVVVMPGVKIPPALAAGPDFERSRSVQRAHTNSDGSSQVVEQRDFAVKVSTTTNLRSQQQIDVSWSGAHPTGNIVSDPNSEDASRQEYPVVVLQCRGIDSGAAPQAERVDPTTCWTQTPAQRYDESSSTSFPAWRLDSLAAAEERRAIVDPPRPPQPGTEDPNKCTSTPLAARFVWFYDVTGAVHYIGNGGCAGMPSQMQKTPDPASPPHNTVYGVTGLDGTGSVKFVVWTAQDNSNLGCSDKVPCSLVVVPILGASCDLQGKDPRGNPLPAQDIPATGEEADKAKTDCQATGRYAPGELHSRDSTKDKGDTAVVGALWWSPSNWANRITVPLMLEPPPGSCDPTDTRASVDLSGSELMAQAMTQWAPAFCRDANLFKIGHIVQSEPAAKSALDAGSISAALVSRPTPDGWAGPTAMSPVAVTGFTITYAIDGADRRPYPGLRMTPRLLAKLLSESYPAFVDLKRSYAGLASSDPYHAMATNPLDMSVDPEFKALNPGIPETAETQVASTLLSLSGTSDVIHALTAYLNADPEARAFLDGKPDPWGMVVNPQYRGIALPGQFWPLQDTFVGHGMDLEGCLLNEANEYVPVPLLPLVAAPQASLQVIAQSMEYGLAKPAILCSPRIDQGGVRRGGTLKPRGRLQPGSRFMLGLTTYGDTERYGLTAAALQATSTVDPSAKFTDSAGRTFVGPSPDSLKNAARLATADEATHTWPIPYETMRTQAGVGAYPGTMIVYAAVPTSGLPTQLAGQLATVLKFAAITGQAPGRSDGQLPAGFLPMTPQNGLGALADYAKRSADAVLAQRGDVPAIKPGAVPTGGPPNGGGGSGGGSSGGAGTPGAGPTGPTASPTPAYTPKVDMPVGYTVAQRSTVGAWTLPIVVLVGLLSLGAAFVTHTRATTQAVRNVRSRLEQLVDARKRQ